jgi:hypothetical protein
MGAMAEGRGGVWTPGDQIVLRYRREGRVSYAIPATVVEDAPEVVALYVAVGTPLKCPVGLDGAPIPRALPYEERAALPRRTGDGVWRDNPVLWLARPGDPYAVGAFWRGTDGAFLDWSVALQAPLRRTGVGFDTEDHVLDVVVAPDLSWRWKDEDEFAAAQRLGRFSPAEAAAIRADGEAAIARVERRAWPFAAGWDAWRPDPSWPVPSLPPDWDAD